MQWKEYLQCWWKRHTLRRSPRKFFILFDFKIGRNFGQSSFGEYILLWFKFNERLAKLYFFQMEALHHGCIPVIAIDSLVLPFSEVIDWKRFSIRIFERDLQGNLWPSLFHGYDWDNNSTFSFDRRSVNSFSGFWAPFVWTPASRISRLPKILFKFEIHYKNNIRNS